MSNREPPGCLGFIFRLLGIGRRSVASETLPRIQVNKFFVSKAEADFFRLLVRVVGERGHVLAQVSLNRLLYFPGTNKTNEGKVAWSNKLARRTIDFLICDPATLRPRLVIELDEPSHARPERQTRDAEVEMMVEAAELPMIHVLTSRAYDTRELAAAIFPHLDR